jgi:hypothetical protein
METWGSEGIAPQILNLHYMEVSVQLHALVAPHPGKELLAPI